MANPSKETSQLADASDKPLIGSQQALVADAAVTATLTGVDTGTDMTAAQAATIVTDLTDHTTKINAILDVLEAHGLMADA
jgi:hypothetical protein